jgi:hypothetical protein
MMLGTLALLVFTHLTVMLQVAPSYAPPGQGALVSVSTVGTHDSMSDEDLETAVRWRGWNRGKKSCGNPLHCQTGI